jgi:hyperosmotically inducible periplasmic protein
MKSLIPLAVAAAFAVPAYAQQKNDTVLPNTQERAQNREMARDKVDTTKDKLPNANERAQNRESVTRPVAGATLTTKVKSALAADAGMRTMTGINVDSEDGVVTLKGKVDTADAKKKAEAIAKKVDGVKRVKNELKVEKKG